VVAKAGRVAKRIGKMQRLQFEDFGLLPDRVADTFVKLSTGGVVSIGDELENFFA
jgi:hypothetical protein